MGQSAARAAARTLFERSVATISTCQPADAGNRWSIAMASEYGSSPVEQAALHARTRFVPVRAASASNRGNT